MRVSQNLLHRAALVLLLVTPAAWAQETAPGAALRSVRVAAAGSAEGNATLYALRAETVTCAELTLRAQGGGAPSRGGRVQTISGTNSLMKPNLSVP